MLRQAYERGQPYPILNWVRGTLAATYKRAGQPEQAEPLYREAVREAVDQFGNEHARSIGAQALLATCLVQQDKFDEAEPIVRHCLAIRERNEPEAWTTFNTQSLLGGILLGQTHFKESEQRLLQGYEGLLARL